MSRLKKFMRMGLASLLVFGIVISAWGQEHPAEAVALKIAPRPKLIDVWNAAKVRARRPLLIAHRGGVVVSGTPAMDPVHRRRPKGRHRHRLDPTFPR